MLSIFGKRQESRGAIRAKRGFTLIEVLVVVGITSLLAGMVLTYSSRGRTQVALYVEAAKLSQVILRAKSLSIATYNDPVVPCGYGVHIDYAAGTYTLFSYKPASCDPKVIGANPISTGDPSANYTVINTNELSQGVEYDSGASPKLSDVLFLPPDPVSLIWSEGDVGASNSATNVGFISTVDQQSRINVRVSPSGQVAF